MMKKAFTLKTVAWVALITFSLFHATYSAASVRLKDIVHFEGVRDNQLVGYGLVVGLNSTGDNAKTSPFTGESLVSMLERLGVSVRSKSEDLKGKNVAAVIVTATLPPFSRTGTHVDVNVSALGDAKSLLGGTLLVTPLLAADGQVYAVSQGTVAVGGFSVGSDKSGSSVTKGVPTSGTVANGAIIEKEIGFELAQKNSLNLSLRNPDFTTASRVAKAINAFTHSTLAQAKDPSTVHVTIPKGENIVNFLTQIEQLKVTPDQVAKVIIDEQNGVIVMGESVRVSTVAISHGNLTIRITEKPQVSQPNAFSTGGETKEVPRTTIEIDDGSDKKMTILNKNISLRELVNGLNALGVGPRDMINILHTVKAAGALQADIEVR